GAGVIVITKAQADELLAFLPSFEQADKPRAEWVSGEKTGEPGVFIMPYPQYDAEVVRFFDLVRQPQWIDSDYDPETAHAWLDDEGADARATIEQVRSMLTCCLRAERFCDGAWLGFIEDGSLVRLL